MAQIVDPFSRPQNASRGAAQLTSADAAGRSPTHVSSACRRAKGQAKTGYVSTVDEAEQAALETALTAY